MSSSAATVPCMWTYRQPESQWQAVEARMPKRFDTDVLEAVVHYTYKLKQSSTLDAGDKCDSGSNHQLPSLR